MQPYRRYAVYYTPPEGPLADFGASWLGWDLASGQEVPHPQIDGLDVAAITAKPRKYGFHATLKAPFRLAEGESEPALRDALHRIAGEFEPVELDGLRLSRLGSFLALVIEGSDAPAQPLFHALVRDLDRFRAPLNDAEIARRKPDRLSPAERRNLELWGYPYVFDSLRFHMTLSGPLDDPDPVASALETRAPQPRPFLLDAVSLVGEAEDGRFRLIERVAL